MMTDLPAETRVLSLADFSSMLMDAFQESNGEHTAVVFVDSDFDARDVTKVGYDEKNKCIVIMIGGGYTNLSAFGPSIARVNGTGK